MDIDPSQPPTEAFAVLSAFLRTQVIRYWVLLIWAVCLALVVPLAVAAAWLAVAMAAGLVRSAVERRLRRAHSASYGSGFTALALAAGAPWAAAPALAWTSPHPAGHLLAFAFFACGYFLVFSQHRAEPARAAIITSSYSTVGLLILVSLWGGPAFWPTVGAAALVASALVVQAILSTGFARQLADFQARQTELIADLEVARDRAEAADRAKSAFVGMVSHELRTPMNGVLGAAQLLAATPLNAEQAKLLDIVTQSGDSFVTLLNDILDMTKIEAERLELESLEVDLAALLERLVASWRPRAQVKGIALELAVTGDLPRAVLSDPTRLGQVLHNLISNALKFTEAGSVRVEAQVTAPTAGRVGLELRVRDTGPGISCEDQDRLFSAFEQLGAATARRFGGTGLGLAISRRLARMMGGDLTVESEVGGGACFILSLELEIAEPSRAASHGAADAPAAGLPALRVLVAEDHPVNRMLLEAWLVSVGQDVVLAEDGQAAVEACGQQAFDVVLMDLNMPRLDGLEATRRIRAQAGPNAQVPILILSAAARDEDHQLGLEAGADGHLDKPISFAELAVLLHQVADGRAGARAAA